MNLLTQIKHKTQKGEEVIMDIGAKASNVLPENFVEQKERSNLAAKDKLPVIFGKLSKWYADLRPVAWSGSYSDLTNKPTIPEGAAANYQVANNDTTEAEGFVADARIVRTHGLEIDGLSRDLSAMNDNGAITGMDAREDGVYITYVPADGADPVSKKLCDPDIKKHKITGKTFSVKASEISASKILGVGIEKFSYSVGVDNANWSYGCNISSSYSDDSASGSVSATWGGPAGAGNYNISATWLVYYLG